MAENDNAAERTIMDFRELNSIVTFNRLPAPCSWFLRVSVSHKGQMFPERNLN